MGNNLLTYGRSLVIPSDPLPQPPGEVADVSLAGLLQEVFDWAVHQLQEFPSSLSTATPGLGPGLRFPNKLKTDISENKFTQHREVIVWTGLRLFQ